MCADRLGHDSICNSISVNDNFMILTNKLLEIRDNKWVSMTLIFEVLLSLCNVNFIALLEIVQLITVKMSCEMSSAKTPILISLSRVILKEGLGRGPRILLLV